MSVGPFLVTFFACAGILAMWVDLRLGERYPRSLAKVVFHGGFSLIALNLVAKIAPALMSPDAQTRTMLALFFILLPGLIYVFLSSIWFLKLVRSALPR